ncbi:hypothetical protein KDU71_11855 [Carboxylicivirga sediminis]|uniref:Uncharacterized protein n=1 Tax=Carboxylicivirga sediminis TaxID=2006564 RepID=A0A941F6Q3_9BACT|nr:hypothetical protein [Carboxylicivirga sediminis]MBR8536255.1 hypothetical protein [Carboxylicivirga sediminis]
MNNEEIKKGIVDILQTKAVVKQDVFESTKKNFDLLKEVLKKVQHEYNLQLDDTDTRIHLLFEDKGEFVAQLKVAGDVLVFHMHTNTFEFDRDHEVWKSDYVKTDENNSYCGVVNIYNFLYDSFRYNREHDAGYLIARVFINKEGHYFVEGKRQKGTGINHFGSSIINAENWQKIIETAILYSLEFDLLVPPYDDVKIISMMQMNGEILSSKMQTGKRLGFVYKADDVQQ